MLSFLVKKDKNKTSTFTSQRFHQHYWILFARHITQMTEITTKNMSLFNNSSRQLRRITEQYLNVENVSEHLKPSSTCHSCHQKKQNISWSIWKVLNHSKGPINNKDSSSKKLTLLPSHLTFWMKHSTRSIYLEESQLFVFFQTQVLFRRIISILIKNTFHVNTKSNTQTQKCHVVCSVDV